MKMFLVDLNYPYRGVKEVEVEVKVCAKTVWAVLPNKKRRLIGSSAFQTAAAAERCRTALLQKIVAHPWASFNRPYVQRATEALKNQTLH